ncbi:MAG: sulfotransferase domain-containing protein [Bacteroidota bacterium]
MKSFIQDIYRRIRYYDSTPFNIKHNDIYLVEYPKSGVTWLSFILANILQKKTNDNFNINFFNFTQFIADINYSKHISSQEKYLPFRIIKSHSGYNPFYNHIVFIIRNPFNVMMSYYAFLSSLKIIDISFNEFIKHKKYGVSSWVAHTESWLKKNEGGHRLCLIKYEDLLNDTNSAVTKLIEMLGWRIETGIIEKAVELSSFSEMKKLEQRYAKNNPKYNLNFVRKGKLGTKSMESESYNYIFKKCENIINEFWSDIDFKEFISIK